MKRSAMYKQDSNLVSLFWGRIGAAILLVISGLLAIFGYTFAEEDQAKVYEVVSSILGGIALIQVTISKVRESAKVDEQTEKEGGYEAQN